MLPVRTPARGIPPAERPRPLVSPQVAERAAALLAERTRLDFRQYKPSFLQRRLTREICRLGAECPAQYLRDIRAGRPSAEELVGRLTVHVTRFFRDPPLFAELGRRFFPALAREVAAAGRAEFRIWVVGCSTGEEAYSAAVTYLEAVRGTAWAPRPRIFATDVDPAVIARARRGRYSASELEPVPEPLRRRYFDPAGRVRAHVRGLITFGVHDLLRDAYIHHLDAIFCRNVLIFLDRPAQHRIFDRLVQALEPRGLLVLGRAESPPPGHRDRTLVPLARKVRVYGPAAGWACPAAAGGRPC